MDKLKALLQKLGIELTADQAKQIDEVMSKEFISAEAAMTAPSAGRYSGTTAWSCIPSSRNSIIRMRA